MQTPARRSQEERSHETRSRVLRAAIRLIADGGVQQATIAAVAGQAGVSPGAIQHQFVDKSGLLLAVIDDGLEHLVSELTVSVPGDAPIEGRVDAFVDAAWRGYGGDFYRAALAVLMHLRGDDSLPGAITEYADRTRQQIDRIWMGLFWDARVSRRVHIEAQRHAFTVMNGLALERLLFGNVPGVKSYLDRLKKDLGSSLGCVADDGQP